MVQILTGLITYLLLAIYCHENHGEPVTIERVRDLRLQLQNDLRESQAMMNLKFSTEKKHFSHPFATLTQAAEFTEHSVLRFYRKHQFFSVISGVFAYLCLERPKGVGVKYFFAPSSVFVIFYPWPSVANLSFYLF